MTDPDRAKVRSPECCPDCTRDSAPIIRDVGLCAKIVTFATRLTDEANQAALAFRSAVEDAAWDGVEETSISLVSTFIRFDPLRLPPAELEQKLRALLETQRWTEAALPTGRRLWTIPVVLGGRDGPQLSDAAAAAGRDEATAIADLLASQTRVLTLGFAPGQPYLGQLPPAWDIPRRTELNPMVPGGALVVAVRQLIIFAGPAPTGWHHVGQTAFRCFRPEHPTPIAFRPGDEVRFREVDAATLAELQRDSAPNSGGATCEPLA